MPENSPLALKATNPADLVAAVSVALGFVPTDSIVLLFTWAHPAAKETAPPRVARMDLDGLAEVPAQVEAMLTRWGQAEIAVVAFSEHLGDPYSSHEQVEAVRSLGGDLHPIAPVQIVTATDGQVVWCACEVPSCRGRRWRVDIGSHRFTAEASVIGRSVRQMSDIENDLRVGSETGDNLVDADAIATAVTVEPGQHPRTWIDHALTLAARERTATDQDDVAHLVAASLLTPVRDLIWSRITRDNAAAARALWSWVARRTEPAHAVDALALAAFAAWLQGDGYSARIACQAATRIDPDHQMTALIEAALAAAVDPSTWTAPAAEDLEAAVEDLWKG